MHTRRKREIEIERDECQAWNLIKKNKMKQHDQKEKKKNWNESFYTRYIHWQNCTYCEQWYTYESLLKNICTRKKNVCISDNLISWQSSKLYFDIIRIHKRTHCIYVYLHFAIGVIYERVIEKREKKAEKYNNNKKEEAHY